jgi:hypothetical protein
MIMLAFAAYPPCQTPRQRPSVRRHGTCESLYSNYKSLTRVACHKAASDTMQVLFLALSSTPARIMYMAEAVSPLSQS